MLTYLCITLYLPLPYPTSPLFTYIPPYSSSSIYLYPTLLLLYLPIFLLLLLLLLYLPLPNPSPPLFTSAQPFPSSIYLCPVLLLLYLPLPRPPYVYLGYHYNTHTQGKDNNCYRLGLTPLGILVYEDQTKIGLFMWYVV